MTQKWREMREKLYRMMGPFLQQSSMSDSIRKHLSEIAKSR